MSATIDLISDTKEGFIFTNLVDFDTKYGHRLDCEGFATALINFDSHLPKLMEKMGEDDLLIITADHGCDPLCSGTDHTREEVPLLVWHNQIESLTELGTRESFSDIAATIAENFKLDYNYGDSFLSKL